MKNGRPWRERPFQFYAIANTPIRQAIRHTSSHRQIFLGNTQLTRPAASLDATHTTDATHATKRIPTQQLTQHNQTQLTQLNTTQPPNATQRLNAGFAIPGLDTAGPRLGHRRGLLEKRQIQLNAILCTRGVQLGIEAMCFHAHEFSLFHSLLRDRPQNAAGQVSQLFPIRWVLVLHFDAPPLLNAIKRFFTFL